MDRLFCYAISVVLLTSGGSLLAEPSELKLTELDAITAAGHDGSASPAPNGGAIVGNGSSANLVSTGEVIISDGAQADARALNLVNASESTVANAVNVFNAKAEEAGEFDGAVYNVDQLNSVVQDQRRLSSLPNYSRGANTSSSYTDNGSSTSASSTSIYDSVTDLERTFITDTRLTDGSVTSDGAPTFSLIATLDNIGSVNAEFNYPGGGGGDTIGAVFNGGFDLEILAGMVFVDTDAVDVTIELPSLLLDIEAMGCFVLNGDCSINGERTETNDTISDHSTLYTYDETASSTEEWMRSGSETTHAAFELSDAQAEYIVIDESEIDVTANYLVSLSGGAQSGVRAMNVVNAAGSAVANGVNVAVVGGGVIASGSPLYNLNQHNIIVHSR